MWPGWKAKVSERRLRPLPELAMKRFLITYKQGGREYSQVVTAENELRAKRTFKHHFGTAFIVKIKAL